MRILISALLLAACGGNDPSPRVIAGGGIGDGAIDDVANVYVIDNLSYKPIVGATVEIGGKDLTTDSTGLAVAHGLDGPQTVAVQAAGYRGEVWQDANGANMTVPVTQLGSLAPQQATLAGSITGYDAVSVPPGHIKAAVLSYSQDDSLDDSENNIQTANSGNVCVTPDQCNWTLASRTGSVTITATIIDRDGSGDTTIIGYATTPSVQVDPSVDQSGIALALVEAGNMQAVTLATGTPPAALPTVEGVVGIELGGNEVVQLPTFAQTDASSVLVPLTSIYAPSSTYRLTVIAETSSQDAGAESATIARGQTSTALTSGTWLEPPTGFAATRTDASLDPVTGANIHSVQWSDDTGVLLDITMFDATNTTATVPALVALPSTGTLTAKAQGLGAAVDLGNFSLQTDIEKIWGDSSEPITLD
ncbi:MAG TPA: hypothetical protein VH143_04355 [Kofleriaceae bacterium]|jgi:hypothetical protein|nr:hypothetical protein [Kofleriaceae bacterium]